MPPTADILTSSDQPGDIFGSTPRLYATVPTLDSGTRRSFLLKPVAQSAPIANIPIDHIVFNENGQWLAVVDELGTITLWDQDTISTQLIFRHSFPAEGGVDDAAHDRACRIVSLRWLHNDVKLHTAVKLAKTGDQWGAQAISQKGSGPCNAVGKEAFVAVTSDGRVLNQGINA